MANGVAIIAVTPTKAIGSGPDNRNVMLQLQQATRNLATSMIVNAQRWVVMANAQSPDVVTLGGYLTNAAASYLNILTMAQGWIAANPTQATAALALDGMTADDFNNYIAPLTTAATALQKSDVSTYAAIGAAANAVIAAVPMPASIFGT